MHQSRSKKCSLCTQEQKGKECLSCTQQLAAERQMMHFTDTAVQLGKRQRMPFVDTAIGEHCRHTGEQSHLPSMMSLSSQQTCPASKFLFDWDALIPRWRAQAPGLQKQPVLRNMPCKPASFSTSLNINTTKLNNNHRCSCQMSANCRASIEAVSHAV